MMPTLTPPPDTLTPADVNDAATLAIVRALTSGKPGPDGRPGHMAVGDAHAISHFLATAPDGALADDQAK
jgi:hypothetical protein